MLLETSYPGEGVPLASNAITGVAKERVDPLTLQLIHYLFPGDHGLTFLAAFLRLAEAKQLVLPELGSADSADMAVVTAQSIRALAKLMGMSYDTVEKYVVVMSQLQLLFKKRSVHQILFYFPLRLCKLPEPEVLDRIQEMRPAKRTPRYRAKVRSFASQVKRRFVLLCKGGTRELAISSPLEEPLFDPSLGIPRLMEDIHLILQQEVDSQTASRLVMKIGEAVSSHWPQRRPSLQKGDADTERFSFQAQKSSFSEPKDDSRREAVPHQSRHSGKKGDSVGSSLIRHHQESSFGSEKDDSERGYAARGSRHSGKKGGFPYEQGIAEGTLQEQKATPVSAKGDFVDNTSASQGRLSPKKGDSVGDWAGPNEKESTFSRPKGDFVELDGTGREEKSPLSHQKGDFIHGSTSTLNVRDRSFLEKEDSTNVQREPWGELAECVEGHTHSCYQYKQYLETTDPRLVLATYLYVQEEVWSRQHTPQPVKAPGAYFRVVIRAWKQFSSYEAACQAYIAAHEQFHSQGKTPSSRDRLPGIPIWVQELVERLHGWSYTDVKDELAVQFHRRKAGTFAVFSPSQESLFEQEVLEPEVPSCWMTTEAEAEALIERMVQEAPTIGSHAEQLRVRPYRLRGSGMTVFVVDALIERTPQVYAAPEQWEAYFLPYLRDLEEGRWSLPPQV